LSGLSSTPSIDVVRIKLKHHDWEIEVTCSENKVKEIVANELSGLDSAFIPRYEELKKEIDLLNLKSDSSTQINSLLPRTSKRVAHQSSGYTCRGLLEKMLYDGYFKTERLLRNIHEELSRNGYNYYRSAVSHALTDMVRERTLTRIGTMRNYRYIQTRPSEAGTFQSETNYLNSG
jgi:hypothetical protein